MSLIFNVNVFSYILKSGKSGIYQVFLYLVLMAKKVNWNFILLDSILDLKWSFHPLIKCMLVSDQLHLWFFISPMNTATALAKLSFISLLFATYWSDKKTTNYFYLKLHSYIESISSQNRNPMNYEKSHI